MNQRVRAVLLTGDGQLLCIRRERPGLPTYWVLPGGGVEDHDNSLEHALIREIQEELGGQPTIRGLIHTLDDGDTHQHIYLADIDTWNPRARSGPEFNDPTRGRYELELITFTADQLATIDLKPDALAHHLIQRLRHMSKPDELLEQSERRAPDDIWPALRRAFDADHALAETLRSLRGKQRPETVTAMAEALRRGYERETLTLLGRLEPYFTEALVDNVVPLALATAEAHRVRHLLGRLPHRRARELVGPAVSRVLETEPDTDAWTRMAELLDHLGLYDERRKLDDPSSHHLDDTRPPGPMTPP